jgi:DNA repair protein REV1
VQGHGICDNHSRSVTLPRFVASQAELAKAGRDLLKAMHVPPREIRGIGLSVPPLASSPACVGVGAQA